MLALAAVGSLTLGHSQEKAAHRGVHEAAANDAGLDDVTAFAVLPPSEIARRAKIEMKALKAVHYRGFMVVGGDKMALTGGVDGQRHCQIRLGAVGAAMRVRRVSDAYFVRFDREVLIEHPELMGKSGRASESLIEILSGKWWKAPVDSVPEFRGMCSLHSHKSFVGAIVKSLSLTTVRGDVARVAGRMAVALVPTQGYGELWVAATGKHRVVRASDGVGNDSIDVVLAGFDRPVKVTVPPYRMIPGFATV